MEERSRLLSMVDIFEPLSEQEIEHLDGQLPDRHLEGGEIFFGPEDLSERLFILQKGKVRIFRTTPDGRAVEDKGEPLLYVSRKVSAAFDGCVVDLVETPEGVGFSIGPPEAGREARS